MLKKLLIFLAIFVLAIPAILYSFQYFSRAAAVKANIVVDVTNTGGAFPDRWKALAQGGEEAGVAMLHNVVPQVAALYPKYIRIDHIYDFYNVVSRESSGKLAFNFDRLDQTVCDIYHAGAMPFFSLGYMPPAMSSDGTLVGKPTNWDEWSLLVQKTIERYSGKNTVLPCGALGDYWKTGIYYEVWNEPDLETFGKWYYSGNKNYEDLYYYSAKGATAATNVYPFKIGGPVTTALYKNWIQQFLDFVSKNNLRIDFISWHHYSKRIDDFEQDVINLNEWLSPPQFQKYQNLPKIISEWGFDSNVNSIADTNVGAAQTVAAIRNFLMTNIDAAFLFEIKDGKNPSWGILTNDGQEKPRYHALEMLNDLDGKEIFVSGEGTYVSALASINNNQAVTLVLVNYDINGQNTEAVPVTFKNLSPGNYDITKTYLSGQSETTLNVAAPTGEIDMIGQKSVIMTPNQVVSIELKKSQ